MYFKEHEGEIFITVIKDGTGTSSLAKVNINGQLHTYAISEPIEGFIGLANGDYYILSTIVSLLNSTNEHFMVYIQNNNPDKLLCIVTHLYGYNGGNTNHNRTMKFKFYKNPNIPTANNILTEAGNANYTSGNLSGTICYIWDGVGDGMTHINTNPLTSQIVGQGLTQVLLSGVPIVGFGQSMGISITAEEVGNVTIVVRFYMIDKNVF